MKCPICGSEISDTAESCPMCGRVIDNADRDRFVPRASGPAMTYNDPNLHKNVNKYNPMLQGSQPSQQYGQQYNQQGGQQYSQQQSQQGWQPYKQQPVEQGTGQYDQQFQPPIKKSTMIIIASSAAAIILLTIILVVIFNKKDTGNSQTAKESTTEATTEYTTQSYQFNTGDEVKSKYFVGETWIVDGQWAVTLLGSKKTEERNEFSDKEPAAVYEITYMYTNLGYESEYNDGLYVLFDSNVVDSAGKDGYSYPLSSKQSPKYAPVGATCFCSTFVGLDNDGTFTSILYLYDSNSELYKQSFNINPEVCADGIPIPAFGPADPTADWENSDVLHIGDTWTVENEWSITIDGVSTVEDGIDINENGYEAVYKIDYTYKNLGYDDKYVYGLYMTLSDMVVDSHGMVGRDYPAMVDDYPKEIDIGETCKAQDCVCVLNSGDFKITIIKCDSKGVKQKKSFVINVN